MKNTVNENIKKVREAIENNKLVVFIGSGVSLNSEFPSWSGLINDFAEVLGVKTDKELGTDDYLRIAQYFYNERGAKEYFDCINGKFNVKVPYNKIHEEILSMNPVHIITTNYDDLIEQAIENSRLVYDVVCEDKDLPYTPNGHLLIKMHGDLKRKNIVLKEDDYLLYSQKFKLIETFIKSLFVNHVVLFIGYSLQDIDLKLIIKWVKDILGEHFQRAFYLDADGTPKSTVEINYFINMGINMINTTIIDDDYKNMVVNELSNEKGKNIVRCIEYIMNYENKTEDVIDYFYEKLIIFKDLNRLRLKDIVEATGLGIHYYIKDGNKMMVHYTEEIKSFYSLIKNFEYMDSVEISKELHENISKANFIKAVFLNADVHIIDIMDEENKNFTVYRLETKFKSDELNILNILKANNYMEIKLYCEQTYKPINCHKNRYFNELIRAYSNYILHKYISAYEILKKLSKRAYRDKEYVVYYICEFNKSQLVKFIEYPHNMGESYYKEHREKILIEAKEEGKKVDLRQLYYMLPINERISVNCLNDVIINESYIGNKKAKIEELRKKVESESTKIYLGGGPSGLDELKREVHEFWEYTHNYFLMIDDYSDIGNYYYGYISVLLSSYSKKKEELLEKETIFPKEYSNIMPDYIFDELDLYIIYRFMRYEKFIGLLNDFSISEIKTKSPNIFFYASLHNAVQSYINLEFPIYVEKVVCNMIIAGTILDLNEDAQKMVHESLSLLLEKSRVTVGIYKAINYYMVKMSNKNKITLDFLKNIITIFLLRLIDNENKKNKYELEIMSQTNYINNLVALTKGYKNEISISVELVAEVLYSIQYGELRSNKNNIIINLLIPIYELFDVQKKNEIENLITNELLIRFNSKVYTDACINDIISANEEYEMLLHDTIVRLINEKNSSGVISTPDPIITNLHHIVNLVYNDKILNKEKFSDFIGYDNLYNFIYEPSSFNYELFDLKWLEALNDDYLKNLTKDDAVKSAIGRKLKEAILKQDLERKLKDIYFKYFA